MVYVVERYLPGLHRSDLLRGLLRLEQGAERAVRGEVRYLGSTIVLRDEACFCRFEGPSSDAVAEANRQAGLPFDRIVAAVTVDPKGEETVSVSPSIPATVEIRRGRFFGLVAAVAVLAAAVTWVVIAFAFDNGGSTTGSTRPVRADVIGNPLPLLPHATIATGPGPVSSTAARPGAVGSYFPTPQDMAQVGGGYTVGGGQAQEARKGPSIMSLTPAELAAGGFGIGYALPSAQRGPTLESVLASMSPETRRYTKAIMNLTFAQLAAGAAGQP